jgi:hypothetical protein
MRVTSREVFILGAGFSRAVSPHMPLVDELSRHVLSKDTLADRRLTSFANDFEMCLSYLSEDQPWLSEAENLSNRATFLQASGSLATVILRFQGNALKEEMPQWLADLVSGWHKRRSVVITFNYDTLVEKAYTEVIPGAPASAPDHRELYSVPIPSIGNRMSSREEFEPRDTFKYIKLHGSVNWCYSGARSFYGETIYNIGIRNGWGPRGIDPVSDLQEKAPEKVHLVIPPTTAKSSLFNNEIVRSQWRLAQRFVGAASRVYCLGYSLPESDMMIRFLLATSAPDKSIAPVNMRDVGGRYQRLLAPHRINVAYTERSAAIPSFVQDWLTNRVQVRIRARRRT